jgi:NAD(P)H-dependent FMN reductase
MKLTIFNGSPRNKKSNSKILMEHFLEGFTKVSENEVPIHYLANTSKMDEHVKAFEDAENVIIIFPLYCDSMPGLVKEFFERIAQLEMTSSKKVGFIVQSGFPEAIHSIFIERYLKKLAERQKLIYLGTVIKGGVEGIQIMPPMMTKKLFAHFQKLGEHFAAKNEFSPEVVKRLRRPYKFSKLHLFNFKVGHKLGLVNFYWDSNLKKNNAFDIRFAKPYTNT